ncbi:MAG: peroxiredoxin [Armatimonadota bacterium]
MSLVGKPAPDFTAPAAFPGDSSAGPVKTVSLSDYRGKWLVFFWYPLDFTFICPTEIVALSDRLDEIQEMGAEVLGASTDSVYSHRAWMRTARTESGIEGTAYPIIADMTHAIARDYEVLIDGEGIALRGLFIIDPDGVIKHATINALNVGRNVDEVIRTLQALQSGGLCAANWKPGQKNLNPGG